jgi:hypothetical protein
MRSATEPLIGNVDEMGLMLIGQRDYFHTNHPGSAIRLWLEKCKRGVDPGWRGLTR